MKYSTQEDLALSSEARVIIEAKRPVRMCSRDEISDVGFVGFKVYGNTGRACVDTLVAMAQAYLGGTDGQTIVWRRVPQILSRGRRWSGHCRLTVEPTEGKILPSGGVTLNERAGHESELLREFLLGRVTSGTDLRALIIGHAAQLGRMAATCSQGGYLESTLDVLVNTMRYNALLAGPEEGSA